MNLFPLIKTSRCAAASSSNVYRSTPRIFRRLGFLLTIGLLVTGQASAVTVYVTYNATDATANIQSAINSGADTVVLQNLGTWNTGPIFCNTSDQTIIFEPGVLVYAKSGFGTNDSLFTIAGTTNVKLIGHGATLRMRKSEYTSGEWRHVINLRGAVKPRILGLNLEDSGGDGIYVGGGVSDVNVWTTGLIVRDVVAKNNRRQGMSIINAANLTCTDSIFMNTIGTAPQSGVDIEPNRDTQRLYNIDFINCLSYNNAGDGFKMDVSNRGTLAAPIDIMFQHCHSYKDGVPGSGSGFVFSRATANSDLSTIISLRECTSTHSKLRVYQSNIQCSSSTKQTIKLYKSAFQSNSSSIPMRVGWGTGANSGNVTFQNGTKVVRPTTGAYIENTGTGGTRNMKTEGGGSLTVYNPGGATASFTTPWTNVNMAPVAVNTQVPTVSYTAPSNFLTNYAVGASVTFTVTANDPDVGTGNGAGIAHVRFQLQRGNPLAVVSDQIDFAAPYTVSVNTAGYAKGIYLMKAIAVGTDGSSFTLIRPIRLQ